MGQAVILGLVCLEPAVTQVLMAAQVLLVIQALMATQAPVAILEWELLEPVVILA